MSQELTTAFDRAKIGIISKQNSVFISTILFSLKHSWDTEIPTACTNGANLRVNPDFFMGLSPNTRIGLLAHEAWHVAFLHMTRRGNREPHRWNIAADFVINNLLVKASFKLPPTECVGDYYDMSTEQIYDELEGKVLPPLTMEDLVAGESPQDNEQTEQAIADILVKAATQSKMLGDEPGTIPGDISLSLDKLLNPKLPWNVLLQNYMDSYAKDDYTWRRPNRRYMPDHYLPSAFSENLGEIAVAEDVSGSVSQADHTKFISELNGIKTTLNPSLTTVVTFDTQITTNTVLTPDEEVTSISFIGGGGTDLRPVFEYFKKNIPMVLIVFSDLCCSPITEDPGFDVIWVCVGNPSAKVHFGTLIHYEL
jgi:predicted metal-dependent peptidase